MQTVHGAMTFQRATIPLRGHELLDMSLRTAHHNFCPILRRFISCHAFDTDGDVVQHPKQRCHRYRECLHPTIEIRRYCEKWQWLILSIVW